uniref:DM10 domain-containing protein n=1 Tax=Gongylonema pulchrum TaxID=637853 RepID=A0A183DJ54_9BILA
LNKEKSEDPPVKEKETSLVVEEPNIVPLGSRKIRFADENGHDLVEIRYFEVEEGERR